MTKIKKKKKNKSKKFVLFGLGGLFLIIIIIASLLTMGGCEVKTSTATSFGLTIEDAIFAKRGVDGKFFSVKDATYKRGEKVHFILLKVSGFKKGSDGLNKYNLDMEIKDPTGKIIHSQKGTLGEKGHIDLPNNTAPSPGGSITTTIAMQPGKYKFKLTIYDKVGGGSASKTKTFILK